MRNASFDTAAESISMLGFDVRLSNLEGGYTVCFESHGSDQDLGPLLEGLPGDECQFLRLGYVLAGTVEFKFANRTETYAAEAGTDRDGGRPGAGEAQWGACDPAWTCRR